MPILLPITSLPASTEGPEAPMADGYATGSPRVATFDQIFRANVKTVARWATRLGGPRVDRDEVVQEVFMVVERRLAEFRGDGKLSTWLFRITSKVVANHLRAARRRQLWARLTRANEDEIPGGGPLPSEALEQRESTRRFYEVLDGLAPRYREVLTLFELEELGCEAIAELLDRPPATVRVWLHRARRAFVRAWSERQQEDEA